MALATLDDVKRWLKDPTAKDEDLQSWLESVTEWVKRVYNANWDATGTVTETFHRVLQDALLKLKDEAPSAVVVKIYGTPDDLATTLVVNTNYTIEARGHIRLLYARYQTPVGFDEAVVEIPPGLLARVEVTYTASNVVPKPVRDAVACIVAANYAQAGRAVSGLQSENLGDYSYSKADESDEALLLPRIALTYLAPYRRTKRVRST